MVIRNLENKIKLVGIICSFFLAGCIIISVSSIWTARTMVTDAQKKVYVLDGNVPILVNRTTMDETLDVEAKSHVEMFHHFFFTLPPDDKYIKYLRQTDCHLSIRTKPCPNHRQVRTLSDRYKRQEFRHWRMVQKSR